MVNKVVFFWPNIIGYLRIIFAIAAFYYIFDERGLAAILYLISQGLDALDGHAARHFKQCSKYGAVLDMLTDRCSGASLLIVLSHTYPHAWGFFTALVTLDITSHWFQMYSTLAVGKTSHKGSRNSILNFYYTFPYALLVFVAFNEFFMVSLFLIGGPDGYDGASLNIMGVEMGWIKLLAYVSFPIFAGKHFMNVLQLYDAIETVTELDLVEHEKQKSK